LFGSKFKLTGSHITPEKVVLVVPEVLSLSVEEVFVGTGEYTLKEQTTVVSKG